MVTSFYYRHFTLPRDERHAHVSFFMGRIEVSDSSFGRVEMIVRQVYAPSGARMGDLYCLDRKDTGSLKNSPSIGVIYGQIAINHQ
jgi:hypothetical protein